jgi:hypothetical protein
MGFSISRSEAEVTESQSGAIVVYDTVNFRQALFFLKMEETIPPLFALPPIIQSTNGPLYRFVIYG